MAIRKTPAFIFGLSLLLGCSSIQDGKDLREMNVVTRLLANYDKRVVPLPVHVDLSLQVLRVLDLDLIGNTLSLDATLTMSWKDERLSWSGDSHPDNSVSTVRIPSTDIWIPDILLFNNADSYKPFPADGLKVSVSKDGSVLFIPPVKLRSYCNIRSKLNEYAPTVTCNLDFGSWTYDDNSLIHTVNHGVSLEQYDNDFNSLAQIVQSSAEIIQQFYECCPNMPYDTARFSITMNLIQI